MEFWGLGDNLYRWVEDLYSATYHPTHRCPVPQTDPEAWYRKLWVKWLPVRIPMR